MDLLLKLDFLDGQAPLSHWYLKQHASHQCRPLQGCFRSERPLRGFAVLKQHHENSLYLCGHKRALVKIVDQIMNVVVPLICAINYIFKIYAVLISMGLLSNAPDEI